MEGPRSTDEFREVIDRVFGLLRDDPAMGPALRAADAPQRFHFTDLDLVVNIRAGHPAEPNLVWEWSDDVDWDSRTEIAMTADVANRYFQGKLNVPVALARRRVRIGGDLALALKLVPLTQPLGPRYRELLATEYPHLLV
jgi:ubiquinone biosynthesis protein UbiJ